MVAFLGRAGEQLDGHSVSARHAPAPTQHGTPATFGRQLWGAGKSCDRSILRAVTDSVTADEILAVLDVSADHPDLLIRGLQFGDSPETQCLAATLLGDCAPGHTQVRDVLAEAAGSTSDDRLRLAIAASRIQRGETDDSTARGLITLLESGDDDTRIQAAAELRHFGRTEMHDECVLALRQLLTTDTECVRAIAAVTLGDFPHIDAETSSQLRQLATEDESREVRDAARAAVGRGERQDAGTAQAMILTPR